MQSASSPVYSQLFIPAGLQGGSGAGAAGGLTATKQCFDNTTRMPHPDEASCSYLRVFTGDRERLGDRLRPLRGLALRLEALPGDRDLAGDREGDLLDLALLPACMAGVT